MNILFVLRTLEVGGVEVVTVTLANKFAREGHNVSIWAFEKGLNSIETRIESNVSLYIGYGYSCSKANIAKLHNIMLSNKVNLVINQWGLPYLPLRTVLKAKRNIDLKIISICHSNPQANGKITNIDIQLADCNSIIKWVFLKLRRIIWRYITAASMRYVYKNSDLYAVLSKEYIAPLCEYIRMYNIEKIAILPNPLTINLCGVNTTKKSTRNEVLYVGRLENTAKRVSRLIDIWTIVEHNAPDWKLRIIGDGPERSHLEDSVKERKLKNIEFEGINDPVKFYTNADMLLLVSEFEGFPLVLAECMSFGVIPIVYNSFPAAASIVSNNDNGSLIDYSPTSFPVSEFSDKILSLINDKQKRDYLSHNARIKSFCYSVENVYAEWMKVIERIL